MSFNLSIYPIAYIAEYDADAKKWNETWRQSDDLTLEQFDALSAEERARVLKKRNDFPLPLVNYSTQYALSCFEGMKAYSRKNGGVSIFRPDRNAARFRASMEGLKSPGFPEDMFINASAEFVRKNAALGYVPKYNSEWEKNSFAGASAVYIRPFMYSEAAIGIGISKRPYVVICATNVSSYFGDANSKAVTTKRVRAAPHGTGWIKAASNYVISALAKTEAEEQGYMEVIFLDAENHKYVEEGSSCNIFFYLKSGELVTPALGDTILPGITRASVIELAKDEGVAVSERRISIEEAMSETRFCFVTGTAAGITPIESVTHNGKESIFETARESDLPCVLQAKLKGIQYGVIEDVKNWNLLL